MSPQSEIAASSPVKQTFEYSPEERTILIRAAHEGIERALREEEVDIAAPSAHLAERRGAFTTLHVDGNLRGCVGYITPIYPLYRTVIETAMAAAFNDTRFWPVTAEEAPRLQIEISVLSPFNSIRPEDVVVGKHGLLICDGIQRGLLLPQVAIEHHWDREMFLTQTCMKAGLPPDSWRHGATIEAFTAEVFGDIDQVCSPKQ